MVTKVKRTAVTFPPEADAALAKLSRLQRRPKSAIVAELVAEMTPALVRIADLLEAATLNRKALPSDTAERLGALEDLLRQTMALTLDRSEAAVDARKDAPTRRVSGRRRAH
jgi:hypothetical protein